MKRTPPPSKPASRIIASFSPAATLAFRPPPLHRPERLQDAKLLRHRLRGVPRHGRRGVHPAVGCIVDGDTLREGLRTTPDRERVKAGQVELRNMRLATSFRTMPPAVAATNGAGPPANSEPSSRAKANPAKRRCGGTRISLLVCTMCAPRGQNGYKRVQFRLVWSAHVRGSSH